MLRSLSMRSLLMALLLGVWLVCGTQAASVLHQRTLFHLFPTSLGNPLATSASLQHMPSMTTPTSAHDQINHLIGQVNARASSSVQVMSFTQTFENNNRPLLSVPVKDISPWVYINPSWRTHSDLSLLVQLQCDIFMMEYCTPPATTSEEGESPWHHMKFDQPCVLPLVHTRADVPEEDRTVIDIDAVTMVLFLPHHASAHVSPSHAHHAHAHANHHGFPSSSSPFWRNQCQLSLSNDFELDHPDEKHMHWIDSMGEWSEETLFFTTFVDEAASPSTTPIPISSSSPSTTPISISSSSPSPSSPALSITDSLWGDAHVPAFLANVYRQFQVAQSGRTPIQTESHPDLEDGDLVKQMQQAMSKSMDSNSSDVDVPISFLESGSDLDAHDLETMHAKVYANELADTNAMFRLMGQLTDATRTGASATVVWELVIRPLINILRKVLLYALRQLMSKVLIKGLHALVTSTINPHEEPPDESTYTQPPVWDVEDPEELWPSDPAEVPEAIVPPPEQGTELAADSLLQLRMHNGKIVHARKTVERELDESFLQVQGMVGVSGIVDPLLAFLVPVMHNTITQSTHDIAQKGMAKSIEMHSIGPMKEQIHASVHMKSVEMLTEQLTEQLTEHVTQHLIAQLPRTLTILCTQDVHKALSRPLSFSLSYSLTHALTRSPQQDQECVDCESDSDEAKCQACSISKANDYYVEYYTDYYARYFEKYYTFYYTEHYGKLFANDQLKKSAE